MIRTPNTSYTRVDARHGLLHTLEFLAAGVAQRLGHLENRKGLHILDALRPCLAVDVVTDNNGMSRGTWRNGHFDLRMGCGELGEVRLDETAGKNNERQNKVSCREYEISKVTRKATMVEKATHFIPLELPAQSQK